jgi:hypothetical protein
LCFFNPFSQCAFLRPFTFRAIIERYVLTSPLTIIFFYWFIFIFVITTICGPFTWNTASHLLLLFT